jgi:nicotinamidase/pyrazinamidase
VQGSFGAEIVPELRDVPVDFVAKMGTEAAFAPHSAFFDAGKKRATGLENFLRENGVKELYLLGMPTEGEVKNSAIDALEVGFQVFILTDVCSAHDPDSQDDVLKELAEQGIQLLTSTELMHNLWSNSTT